MSWVNDYCTGATVTVRVHARDAGEGSGDYVWVPGEVTAVDTWPAYVVVRTQHGPVLVSKPERIRPA